jgi:hypothetical protein
VWVWTRRRRPRWVTADDFKEQLLGAVKEQLLTTPGKRTKKDLATAVRVLATYDGLGNFEGFLKKVVATVVIDVARRN